MANKLRVIVFVALVIGGWLTISALKPTRYSFNGHCLEVRSDRSEALIGGRDTSIRLPSFEVDFVDGSGATATFHMSLSKHKGRSNESLIAGTAARREYCKTVDFDFGLVEIQKGLNPKCSFNHSFSDHYVPQKFSEKLTLVSCKRNKRVKFACNLRTLHPSGWQMRAIFSDESLPDWVIIENRMHQFFNENLRSC